MKKTKKLLSIILSACMLLSITAGLDFSAYSATLASSGSCGSNVTYTFNSSTGELVISGSGTMTDYDYYSSLSPFYNQTTIKSVTINDGVTGIGSYAFYKCTGLTKVNISSIEAWCKISFSNPYSNPLCYAHNLYLNDELVTDLVIPDSVTSIGNYAFYGCTGLTSITIPDSVTSIGKYAFEDCTGLTKVNINSIEAWCKISFYNSNSNPLYYAHNLYLNDELVTDLVIPDSVTSIGYSAFSGCTGLTSVTIPDSVTSIGSSAFYGCSSLEEITLPFIGSSASATSDSGYTHFGYIFGYSASASYNSNYHYCGYGPASSSNTYYYRYNIPSSLRKVNITGTNKIFPYAFNRCTGLTSVTIPDSVTSIGKRAFYDCTGLISITIPNSVTDIGDSAFYDCTGLTSISIGNSVTSIGDSAFYKCTGLTSIIVDKNNKTYDSRNNCNALIETSTNTLLYGCKNTVIPDSVTSIGEYAFNGCTGLTSITIPNSVTSIGSGAFGGCTELISLTVDSKNTVYDSRNDCNAIIKTSTNTLICGCKNTVIPDNVTSIGNYAFEDCTGLTSVIIPNSVTSIGSGAFRGCTGLTSVTIGDSVTSIGERVFANCTGLTSVTIPDSVTRIYSYAFYGCTGLTSVTIPDSVTSIGKYAFEDCTGLTSVTIPDSVTSIGDYAFKGCTGLTSVIIPDKVTSIGSGAFKDTALYNDKSNWENSVLYIGNCLIAAKTDLVGSYIIKESTVCVSDYAFGGCTRLTSVTIPDSVKSIGYEAFYNCTGLTSVTIGNGVTSIGSGAFCWCKGLTSVTIGNGVTSIGYDAFAGCTGLKKVNISSIEAWCKISFSNPDSNPLYYAHNLYLNDELVTDLVIPDSVTSIGDRAFYNCTGIKELTMPCSAKIYSSANTFYNCSNIEKVTLTKGTGVMRNYSSSSYQYTPWYISRDSIKEIVIEDGVTSIGSYAFEDCTGLTSITIPNSVTSIGDSAFEDCTGIKELTMPCSAKIYNSEYTFYNCSNIEKVTLTKGTGKMQNYGTSSSSSATDTYYGYTPWYISRDSIKELVIEDGVTSIGNYAFRGCTGLTSVTIPDKVTSIGKYAFYNCQLDYIKLGVSIKSIGSGAINTKSTYYRGTDSQWNQINISSNNIFGTMYYKVCDVHDYETIYIAPTCVEKGYIQHKCKYCGVYTNDDYIGDIDPSAHKAVSIPLVAATTTKSGLTKGSKCSLCGTILVKQGKIYSPKSMSLSATSYSYNGKAKTPKVTITDTNGDVISSSNYTVTYTKNINAGTATAKVTFKGNYAGTMSKTFTIKKDAQTISASNKVVTYGKTASLGAKRTAGNGALSYSSSNTKIVSVSSSGKLTAKKIGKATITITAKETSNYKKTTKKVTVTVVPVGTSISSLTAKPGAIVVKIKKQTNQTTGYQIRYSTKSDMSSAKSVTISNPKTVTKTISDLSRLKTYYVQVRTYKTVSGTKYYSAWSAKKSVKTQGKPYLNYTSATIYTTKTLQLKVNEASSKVIWSTSNSSVASVNSNGLVTAKKVGTVTIYATTGSKKLSCKITVKKLTYGKVKGTVLYYFNSNKGYVPDVGSNVYILDTVNKQVVASTMTDGAGNYSFEKIPSGNYELLIKSANCDSKFILYNDSIKAYYNDGYNIFLISQQIHSENITVSNDTVVDVSAKFHDEF